MSSVDHRIVEMEFDNKDFEKRVSTTINSIDELKKSLEFKGIEKGFDNVSKGLSGIGFDKVSGALDAVTSKFSIFGTVGDQVIRSLTNSVTSKLLVAFKEVEGVILGITYSMEGFREYETKIKSIQTIAANTGALSNFTNEAREAITYSENELKVVQDVILGLYSVGDERKRLLEEANYDYTKIQNKVDQIMSGIDDNGNEISNNVTTTLSDIDAALDDLNVYADKTIYSFSNMTQAIGKFTTAGIDLSTSVEAVKGVSNLAALAGADNAANQRAMYNISQALQVGYMQLMDWRSIENAGMATAQFKDAIMETARVHGVAIDQMIQEEGSFNLTLQKKWLTNDILIESLAKLTAFTDDMTEAEREAERSRWAEIGYTTEQIAAIEDLSRVAYESATKVRTFSQLVDTTKEEIGSSYTMMWQNIIGNFDEATNLWTSIHDAIYDNFLSPMEEARKVKWQFFHDNGGREAAIEGLSNTFKGLYTIIHAITDAWKEVFPPDDGRRITALAKSFAEFSKRLLVSDKTAEKIKITFKGLFSLIHIFTTGIKVTVQLIGILIKAISGLSNSGHPILELTSRIGSLLISLDSFLSDSDNIEDAISAITNLLNKLLGVIKPIDDQISTLFAESISPKIKKVFTNLREHIRGFVKGSSEDVNNIQNEDTSGVQSFGEKIKNILDPIIEKIQPLIDIVKKIAKIYFTIVGAIIEFAGKIILRIKDSIVATSDDFTLAGLFQAIMGVQLFAMLRSITKFFDGAKKTLGNFGSITKSINEVLKGVKDVLEAYVLDIKANVLLKIAGAVMMLSASLIALTFIDADKLWKAMKAMTALIFELTLMVAIITKLSGTVSITKTEASFQGILGIGTTLLSLAASILALVGAVWLISKIDTKQLSQGLTGLIYILAVTIGSLFALKKLMNTMNPKEIISAASSLIFIATAINMLVIPLIILGTIPTKIISQGIGSLVKLLGTLLISIGILSWAITEVKPSQIMAASLAMIEMATAINMLVIPILILGALYKVAGKGILAVVALLATLWAALGGLVFLMKQSDAKSIMASALAMIEMATAINMLVIPILILGILPWKNLVTGIGAIGGLLAAMVLTLRMMPKEDKSLGKNLMAMALNISVIATALLMLEPLNSKKIIAISASIAAVLLSFAAVMKIMPRSKTTYQTLSAMAASIAVISLSLYALSTVKSSALMKSVKALLLLLVGIAGVSFIVGVIPGIGKGLFILSNAIMSMGIGMLTVGGGIFLLITALKILSTCDFSNLDLGKLGREIANFVTSLLVGLIDGTERILAAILLFIPTFGMYLLKGLEEILKIIVKAVPKIIDYLVLIFCAIVDGIGDNAYVIFDHLIRAIINIFNAVSTWISDENNFKDLTEAITNLLTTILAVMLELCKKFVEVGWEIVKNIKDGLENNNVYDYFYDGKGQEFMSTIYKALNDLVEFMGFQDIGRSIIHWITEGFDSYSAKELATGLIKTVSTVGGFAIGGPAGALLGNKLSNLVTDRIDAYYNSKEELKNNKKQTQYIYDTFWETYGGAFRASGYLEKHPTMGLKEAFEAWFEDNRSSLTSKSLVGKFFNAGTVIGDALRNGFESSLDIASPSGVGREDGEYFVEGVVEGLENNQNDVSSKAKSLAETLSGGLFDNLPGKDSLKDKLTSIFNIDPGVTGSLADDFASSNEVIDLDNIGLKYDPGVTGSLADDFNSTVSVDKSVTSELTADLSASMEQYQQDMLNTTKNIYDELSSLRGYISEIKIQLDTNALVGSIVGPMDQALGERSTMKARGI